jgi:hypothetical protein
MLLGGCNLVFGLEAADHTDADIDAPIVDANGDGELGAWNTPVPIPAFATTNDEQDPHMSLDGLELYCGYTAVASPTGVDIVASRRVATNQEWPAPVKVIELSTTAMDKTPRLYSNDRIMLLASDRPGSTGGEDVWRSTRSSTVAAWTTPALVAENNINTTLNERTASPCLGGTHFIFTSDRLGQLDLFEWVNGVASPIPAASSPTIGENTPFVTEDCLTLYLTTGATGNGDLYVTTRPSIMADFAPPVRIEELASPQVESDPWVSADGRHIIFSSNRSGTTDLWEAFR